MKKFLTLFSIIMLLTTLLACETSNNCKDMYNNKYSLDRTIMTLGIMDMRDFYFVDFSRRYVAQFNEENEDYYIEVITYRSDDLIRLWTELAAGRGPDIIYSFFYDDSLLSPMKNQGILLDLWAFIDADPEINRDDFFQNILQAMQSPDGSLQMISTQFYVWTLVSTSEIVDNTRPFTISYFFELLRYALDSGMAYPMDRNVSGPSFILHMLMYTDIGIIDFEYNVSHFESQEFYNLLELALLMQGEATFSHDAEILTPIEWLGRGEHLFVFDSISGFDFISNLDFFARYETLLENFLILGFPSEEGIIFEADLVSTLGINANSGNADAAWSFVRQYLLPEPTMDFIIGLPLRIDSFEQQIFRAMHEIERYLRIGDIDIPVAPLTAEGADMLREIVKSVSSVSVLNYTIANILMEELQPFFAERRSVEETARVLQRRVQLYLHERG